MYGHVHNCPRYIGAGSHVITHDELNKDDQTAHQNTQFPQAFAEAFVGAKKQTTHEWCRFQNLVYQNGQNKSPKRGAEDVRFLCEKWVENRAAANDACSSIPSFPLEAQCSDSVLSLGGLDNWVDLGNAPLFDQPTTTIEAWVYLRSQPQDRTWLSVFNKWVSGAEDEWISTGFWTAGAPDIGFWTGNPSNYIQAASTTPLEVKKWHHLAGVYDGSAARFYVDGLLAGLDTDPGPILHSTGRAYIGANPARGLPGIDGFVGELRISSSAKYSGTFQPEPNLQVEGDTVGLWRLDEGKVSVIHDTSGNGLDGTLSAGAKWEDVPSRK